VKTDGPKEDSTSNILSVKTKASVKTSMRCGVNWSWSVATQPRRVLAVWVDGYKYSEAG